MPSEDLFVSVYPYNLAIGEESRYIIYARFVNDPQPWFPRGACQDQLNGTGVLAFDQAAAYDNPRWSSRVV